MSLLIRLPWNPFVRMNIRLEGLKAKPTKFMPFLVEKQLFLRKCEKLAGPVIPLEHLFQLKMGTFVPFEMKKR